MDLLRGIWYMKDKNTSAFNIKWIVYMDKQMYNYMSTIILQMYNYMSTIIMNKTIGINQDIYQVIESMIL